jgi:hypothetical protein
MGEETLLPASSIRLLPDGFLLIKRENQQQVSKRYDMSHFSVLPDIVDSFFSGILPDIYSVEINLLPPVLIPAAWYTETLAQESLNLQYGNYEIDVLFSDLLADYQSLYFLSSLQANVLENLSRPCRIQQMMTGVYGDCVEERHDFAQMIALVPDASGFADFFLQKNHKIHLINRFTFTSDYDILYYLLNITKQYGLSAKETGLCLYAHGNDWGQDLFVEYFAQLCEIN